MCRYTVSGCRRTSPRGGLGWCRLLKDANESSDEVRKAIRSRPIPTSVYPSCEREVPWWWLTWVVLVAG